MKSLALLLTICLFLNSGAQNLKDWIDFDLLKSKKVKSFQIWEMDDNGKDGILKEGVFFKNDYRIDSTAYYTYDKDFIQTKFLQEYTYDKKNNIYEIVCKKKGTPYKSIRHYYEGGRCIKQVHFKTISSFDLVEGFNYLPDGKVLKKYSNLVKKKIMNSELYQYNKEGKRLLTQIKKNNVLIEREVYIYNKDSVKVRIINNNKAEIGTKEYAYFKFNQWSFFKLKRPDEYLDLEFVFYEKGLVKSIRSKDETGALKNLYEIEYQFFE